MSQSNKRDGREESDGSLDEALAALILSTRTRSRPMPLTEVAKWLDVAINELGSIDLVAERIGLSGKMLKQFASVSKLSEPVKAMFESRELDSVDAATHMLAFSTEDQLFVARAVADKGLDTSDVRAIAQLRKKDNVASIETLMQSIVESKVTRQYVAEFSIRGGRSLSDIRLRLAKYIPDGEIVSIETNGPVGQIILTADGRKSLSIAAKSLGVPLKQAVPQILRS